MRVSLAKMIPRTRQGVVTTAPNAALLVVDDDEGNRYTLTRLLTRAGYANVVAAASGREALEMLRAQKFESCCSMCSCRAWTGSRCASG